MTVETHQYMIELKSYFNTHNIPIFIFRRFARLVNEASNDNQSYIAYKITEVTINEEDQSYFHYAPHEPKRDKEIMAEIADLLDGYIFYVTEAIGCRWEFIRIKE
ncbi:MAG: hypothetical protein IKO36_10495 [Bacteroidaceae bacterium]|nr:hypothetical protein [Bacteroidaceae bacterium]